MTQITFGPFTTNGNEYIYKTKKANAVVEMPTYFEDTDICGNPSFINLGLHASFQGRADCADLSTLVGFAHYSLKALNPPVTASAFDPDFSIVSTTPYAAILPTAAELTASGYVKRGPQWVEYYPSSKRIKFTHQTRTKSLVDACNKILGIQVKSVQTQFSYDTATCEYKQVAIQTWSVGINTNEFYTSGTNLTSLAVQQMLPDLPVYLTRALNRDEAGLNTDFNNTYHLQTLTLGTP